MRLERWGIKDRGEEEMRDGNRDGESRRWELGMGGGSVRLRMGWKGYRIQDIDEGGRGVWCS